jgi:prepilin-type N-terminal cleavage/methylation domain-containing protein
VNRDAAKAWVAHASRVLVSVSHRNDLPNARAPVLRSLKEKSAIARTPSPTRETCALPGSTAPHAFTIIEVLIVISIIVVLAGLILATSGYVQTKGKRSRAEAEIAAISAALENYKADNGIYPQHSAASGGDHALYQALAGDGDDALGGTNASTGVASSSGKIYMPLKPSMAQPNPPDSNTRVVDPWTFGYNYLAPGSNNPTFDLWSTGPPTSNGTRNSDPAQFIKNW